MKTLCYVNIVKSTRLIYGTFTSQVNPHHAELFLVAYGSPATAPDMTQKASVTGQQPIKGEDGAFHYGLLDVSLCSITPLMFNSVCDVRNANHRRGIGLRMVDHS